MAMQGARQDADRERTPQAQPRGAATFGPVVRRPGRSRDARPTIRRADSAERLAHALGWFSIGLGLTEVLATRALARAIGLDRAAPSLLYRLGGDDHLTTLRLFGVREIANGLGIFSRPRSAGWVWARVAGDALDLAFLISAFNSNRTEKKRAAAAIVAVAGATAIDVLCGERLGAPRVVSRRVLPDGSIRVVKNIAINRAPEECYRFWRDFTNLPRIMRHLERVQITGDTTSRWTARAPAGAKVEWDAEIVEDVPNELIAWRSIPGADVDNDGSVRFQPIPKGSGTLLRVVLRYRPPAGRLGGIVAKILGQDPEQRIREDLRQFKQVMETGEVITVEGQPSGPPRWSIARRLAATR